MTVSPEAEEERGVVIMTLEDKPRIKPNFNVFTIPFVDWIFPLLLKGAKKPLIDEDLYDLPTMFKSDTVKNYLINFWIGVRSPKKDGNESLAQVILKRFGGIM